jgi:hypothetical protein
MHPMQAMQAMRANSDSPKGIMMEQTMARTSRAGRTRIAYVGGPLDGASRVKTERARASLYRDLSGEVMTTTKGDRVVHGRSATAHVYVLTNDVRADGRRTLTYTYR